ncbi:MAG: crotonyl-CoA carboxylase/reductase [Ferrimicrobium sp.]
MTSFLAEAVRAGASPEELENTPLPDQYRAAYVNESDIHIFDGLPSSEKDPRRSLKVGEVPMPEIAPDEVLVAVMASSINYNTVWSSIFEPVSTFTFLKRLGATNNHWARRHNLPYHVLGADGAGVIVRAGSAVRKWTIGDTVTIHCNYVDDQDPASHDDSMLTGEQRIWGFETNFGGLADFAVVKANQLMPKPTHLSWEEAAVNPLCNSTSYRMLVSKNGANLQQGQVVLVWGATGGIGSYAIQYVLNGGGIPVGVVSSPEKASLLHEMGCEAVIDRRSANYRFWSDPTTQDESEWRRFGRDIRDLVGQDPDIVFEHPGRDTMGASVFVAKRGGLIMTCAATTGYMVEFDNRHLWMKLKTIRASHFANYREAWEANRLVALGKIQPVLSTTYDLDHVAEAVCVVRNNAHEGKVGILCLSTQPGQGITNPEFRATVGEKAITRFQRFAAQHVALDTP